MAVLALLLDNVMKTKLMNDDDLSTCLAKLDCFLDVPAIAASHSIVAEKADKTIRINIYARHGLNEQICGTSTCIKGLRLIRQD
jgi:hypothetical protein